MINDKAGKVIEELLLFKSLQTSEKGTDFTFDCVHLLYYKWRIRTWGNGSLSMTIQTPLLNIQIICRMSMKVLKSSTQAENVKY